MKILVLNSGSSSIKFKLFDMDSDTNLVSGIVEEIGMHDSRAEMEICATGEVLKVEEFIKDHHDGIVIVNDLLKKSGFVNSLHELDGIGHRVVHGGENFIHSAIIDDKVIAGIEEVSPLAPLHNPGHLAGIRSAMMDSDDVPHVAVFDTVFHQTIPKHAYTYAVPYEYYKKYHVRKYGFHGTSHNFVSCEAAKFLEIDYDKFNAITLHIGNGASACAIFGGQSIDTSMGITPLEGLVMGTRSGDIDPAALLYLSKMTGKNLSELDNILNKKSGLLGLCGTNDLRKVMARRDEGDELAKLAYDIYIYRIIKYIGAYYAVLGRVDALIFTAGVGENAVDIRKDVCNALNHLGIKIDEKLNSIRSKQIRCIDADGATIKTLIVPTNEELAIARETITLIKN